MFWNIKVYHIDSKKKKRVHWYYYCEKQLYTLYLA